MATPILTDTGNGDGRIKRGPKAAATSEAVAGTTNTWLASYLRSMPRYIDDVTRDFGDDLYERMKNDPQVRSDLNTIKLAVMGGGLSITPAVNEEDERYKLAEEIRNFCEHTITNLRAPFLTKTFRNMLDALAFGNKVAEKVYRQASPEELAKFPTLQANGSALVLDRLKVKPRSSVAFVVDAYMNMVGIAAMRPGMPYTVSLGSYMLKPEDLLPLAKFAILVHNPSDEDPRGQSILRTAYNAWWMKQQTWGEYLAYITRFASPSIVVTMPEDAEEYNTVNEETGLPETLDPKDTVALAIQALKAGSYAIFDFGTETKALEMSGEGGAYLKAIDLYDRQISKAILLQTLATMEGEHQARAASQTHENILNLGVGYVKTWGEEFIEDQIWKPDILLNYGPEALELCPKAMLGEDSPEDKADFMTAVFAGEKAGYWTPEQKQHLDARMKVPPRTAQDVADERTRRAAMPLPGEVTPGQTPNKDKDEKEDV